jgi:hypothetical protein
VYPLVAMQQLSKDVAMAKNTHATIEKLLDMLFFMRSVLYEKKVGN